MKFMASLITLLASSAFGLAQASDFKLETVTLGNGLYALIGPTTDRTYENHGLNANFGVVDTPEGAILIDSGASAIGAALLEAEVKALTGKPVKWVINTGAQDHRWLGNAYFLSKGAELIAHTRTVTTQKAEFTNQIQRLRPALLDRLDGTEAAHTTFPTRWQHQ